MTIYAERSTEKLVVCIDKKIKHWWISRTVSDSALPPMNESNTLLPNGFEPIVHTHSAFPFGINSWREKDSQKIYEDFVENFPRGNTRHFLRKKIWLWNAFVNIYSPEYQMVEKIMKQSAIIKTIGLERSIMLEQQRLLQNCKKKYKIWLLWKRHMGFEEEIPGEAFT